MAHFMVTTVGVDRPGIVASVTKPLWDLGCNLEDTSSVILRGHFTMMLVVAAPEGISANRIEGSLAEPARLLDLSVTVHPIARTPPAEATGERWTISVYGADKPGIVHRFAQMLSESGVNILDMSTRLTGEPDPVYTMLLEGVLPAGMMADRLEVDLQGLAMDLGVEVSMHLSEGDLL